jgi:hypothetical protein
MAEGNNIEAMDMDIEDGDIIKAVNDLKINDMTDGLRAVYELSDERDFQVEVEKGSQTKTLHYQLDASANLLVPVLSNLFNESAGSEH